MGLYRVLGVLTGFLQSLNGSTRARRLKLPTKPQTLNPKPLNPKASVQGFASVSLCSAFCVSGDLIKGMLGFP